jgi:asparagine synthase (glutamine-hydrolysing)
MCGIALAFGADAPDEARIRAAIAAMGRRGPDASGVHRAQVGGHHATLLHTRLSIIDLDPRANQPFVADGLVLIHNGEIYNYLEIRDELRQLGHAFETESDTEVLLAAYRQWGADCLDRLEGMWAFALLDMAAGRLVICRDRFGEKPLFYSLSNGTLYAASEVKALAALAGTAPQVDFAQVQRYLVNGYKALYKKPATFFKDIKALPAASVALIDTPMRVEPVSYWQLRYQPDAMSAGEAADGTREHLMRSVKLRLRSDVPVAFCLSGGVDSSALAAIAAGQLDHDIHTFSIIDQDERYDETRNIRCSVAKFGCAHHEIKTSTENFLERLTDQITYHDAPIVTISYYVHEMLSQAISEAGYRVAVSGTAADEIFTGYYDHYNFWLAERSDDPEFEDHLADWRASYGAYVQNPILQDPLVFKNDPSERGHIYLNRELFNGFMKVPLAENFFEATYCHSSLRNRMMNELCHEVVPVILNEDDLNSMHWSVENRSPYLDRGLVEFAYSIPSEHLIRDGYVKWPLRAAVEGLLPDQVRLDKRKRGFNASIDSLLDRTDPDVIDRLLSPGPIFELVRREAIEDFLTGDMSDNSFSKFLFSFVSAKIFLESGIAEPASSAKRAT